MKKSSMGSPFKIVFLDEADRISDAGQKMLRNVIEDYSDGVRFIATANYPNKISPALHSRFQQLEVSKMDLDDVIMRVVDVIEAEGIQFNDEIDVMSHIDHFYPDMRKILNSIDQHTDEENNLHRLSISAESQDCDAWDELWKGDPVQFSLDLAIQLASTVDQSNFEQFYETMYQNHRHFPNDVNALILLSQYLDRAQTSANQQLHLHAFLYHAFLVDDK
jgi:DNA polymerase III delta prime subunit